jgi:hypothetical protein
VNNQHNNNPFQENPLLQSNPIFMNNMNYNNSAQMQQIQMMNNAYINKIKEIQNMKKKGALNDLNSNYTKDKIREIIIAPQKIYLTKDEKFTQDKEINKLKSEYDNKSDKHLNTLKTHWGERTNVPYKGIIKDDKHSGKFLKGNYLLRKKIIRDKEKKKLENELIVHKVTNADKEGVEDDMDEFKKGLEVHDNELKSVYSLSKKAEHKKKFEYNHKSKFRVRYEPSDHTKLKKDKISYYKRAQKKMEDGKDKHDNIIETLINDGTLDENEINTLKENFSAKKKATLTTSSPPKSEILSCNKNDSDNKNDNRVRTKLVPMRANIVKPTNFNDNITSVVNDNQKNIHNSNIFNSKNTNINPRRVSTVSCIKDTTKQNRTTAVKATISKTDEVCTHHSDESLNVEHNQNTADDNLHKLKTDDNITPIRRKLTQDSAITIKKQKILTARNTHKQNRSQKNDKNRIKMRSIDSKNNIEKKKEINVKRESKLKSSINCRNRFTINS